MSMIRGLFLAKDVMCSSGDENNDDVHPTRWSDFEVEIERECPLD